MNTALTKRANRISKNLENGNAKKNKCTDI